MPVFLSTFTLFSFTLLSSSSISADDSIVDNINITVPASCSLFGTGQNSHNATIVNGTYEEDIGTTTLKAFCNDAEGFAIYAAEYTGDEIGGTNSNKLVGTSASGNATIVTGLATSAGNPDVSNWAMKLATPSSPTPTYPITIDSAPNIGDSTNASFSNYHTVPNEYVKVAHRDSATDIGTNVEGSTLTTTYRAYISKTQAADTYSGKVIYTLVHPASEIPAQPQITESGCIRYYTNTNMAEGSMGCQPIESTDVSATLLASNFSRSGYGFAGWSDVYDYNTNSDAKFYGPQEDISFEAGQYSSPNDGLSLYAVWIKSEGSLQDQTKVTSLCGTDGAGGSLITAPIDGTANLSSVSALTDQRDNQTYAIARLADGKCWMIENLRLEKTNSDNSTGALAQGYGTSTTYGNFIGLANPESTGFATSYSANSLYYSGTQSDAAIIDIGTSDYPGYRMPRYNNLNTTSRVSNPTSNQFPEDNVTSGMYSYGNYYSWPAAIANTASYNSPTATDADSKTSETVNTSLCPTGWRLPYGRNTGNGLIAGSFYNLNYTINNSDLRNSVASKRIRSYPNNFLESGEYDTDKNYTRGVYGCYWTSTASSSSSSYAANVRSSNFYPGTMAKSKYLGYSIRCVAGS